MTEYQNSNHVYLLVGVGYTGVKNTFLVVSFLQQFLFVGNSLSQNNMAKFLTTGLTKMCDAPSRVT